MARSALTRPLTKISVAISHEAEEAIAALFDCLFGQAASIYTDAQTGKTQATVYLESARNDSDRKRLKEALTRLKKGGLDIGSGRITIAKVRKEDWAESWKRHFKPITVGKSLLIKPSWSKRKPTKTQSLVVIDPGLSFGTGQHATTSFCLQQLVACRAPGAKQSFLDIGTGSGILAIAAQKIGYSPVEAFDFDPESVRVATENAVANQVANLISISQKDLTKMPRKPKARFDVICANLIFDLLITESERITSRLAPAGQLILAGILKTQFSRVQDAYGALGFKLISTKVEKEWQSGRFSKDC